MGISAVSSTMLSTFGQLNQEVHAKGTQAAKEHSEEAAAYYKVSPFGNDTKIGTSPFQQSNAATVSIGEQKTAAIMDKAMSYMRVSNFGTETSLGHSKFQQANEQIISNYKTWQNGKTLGSRMDISA